MSLIVSITDCSRGIGGLPFPGSIVLLLRDPIWDRVVRQMFKITNVVIAHKEKTMNNKILVTYASRAGSTAGVAEAIGRTLTEKGALVDVLPTQDVKDLASYRAVVAGSAIRGQKWLPEAMQFLRDNQPGLSGKPFAAFMVCITLSMANAEQYREGLKSWMGPVRDMVRPVCEGYFAGALDFSRLPFSFNVLAMRLMVLLGVWNQGDQRDWGAIRAWAESLPARLFQ